MGAGPQAGLEECLNPGNNIKFSLFGFFSGFYTVRIPSRSRIEQIGKLLHDQLVQLL